MRALSFVALLALGCGAGGPIPPAQKPLRPAPKKVETTANSADCPKIVPESLPAELDVTGRTESGVIMAMRHRDLPLEGVQFHPESVLTEGGHRLLANWLEGMGDEEAVARSDGLAPVVDGR